jgi:hypothetical protein
MSFLIRVQKNGSRREEDLCRCSTIKGAVHIMKAFHNEQPNNWFRLYREENEVREGRLVQNFDGGYLRTNDRKILGVILDDFTIMPEGMSKVESKPLITPFSTMRRGKGRYKTKVSKKPTRHHSQ